MSTIDRPKAARKTSQQDWHSADIKAALEKAGWSFRRLSKHHGYASNALKNVLAIAWPHGELLVAEAIGKKPWEIWPSRYRDEQPNRGAKLRGGKRA